MKALFDTFVLAALEDHIHDFHLKVGQPPVRRVLGKIKRTTDHPLSSKQLDGIASSILNPAGLDRLQRFGSVDVVYSIPDKCRLRVNVFFQRGTLAFSARVIPPQCPDFRKLGLPPEVQQMILGIKNGLILLTGSTNSGKTTTLNSLIMEICGTRSVNVITIEDPIEFIYPPFPHSVVNQREVGTDTRNIPDGIHAALRQSPDILVVGEFRTPEAVLAGLQAAETGHLVIATLHTRNAVQTISRLVSIFPPRQIDSVRHMLANTLKMVLSQALFPAATKKGMALAFEVLPVQVAVPNLIRANRIHEIPNILNTGTKFGCIAMQASIEKLVKSNKVHLADIPMEFQPQPPRQEA